MDKLDQLIIKFKEAKEELEKNDTSQEDLEKYFSPHTLFGSQKVKSAVKTPSGPTGIDKIKAVSKETIKPTSIMADDQNRAKAMGAPTNPTAPNKPAKLTGLDRIKAESQKPIVATTVKKDEAEEELTINKSGQWGLNRPQRLELEIKNRQMGDIRDTHIDGLHEVYKRPGAQALASHSLKSKHLFEPPQAPVVKDEDEDTEKAEGIRPEVKESMDRAIANYAGKKAKPELAKPQNMHGQDLETNSKGWPKGTESWAKKSEDVKKSMTSPSMAGKMRGGGSTGLTHPNDMSRASELHSAMSGAYQPPKAVRTPAKKLTGLDRVKATSQERLSLSQNGQWNLNKDDDTKTAVSPPKLNTQGKAAASAPKESYAGQIVTGGGVPGHALGRGDATQEHIINNLPIEHQYADHKNSTTGTVSPVTTSIPKVKPAAEKYGHLQHATRPLFKPEVSLKFEKTINSSYAPGTNMVKDEKISLNKGGQWSLEKGNGLKALRNAALVGGLYAGVVGNLHQELGQQGKKLRDEHHMSVKNAAKPATTIANDTSMDEGGTVRNGANKVVGHRVDKSENTHDEKGRCNNCHSKACDGLDCKIDHEKKALESNKKQNEGFKNKIKGL